MNITTWEEFQALPDNVREDVLEKRRYWNVDGESWHEHIIDGFKEQMAELGITANQVYFSGFYSQGDGACFEGSIDDTIKVLDLPEFTQFAALKEGERCLRAVSWYSRGRYCHEESLNFSFSLNEESEPWARDYDNPLRYQADKIAYDDAMALMTKFEPAFTEWVKSKCRELYSTLEEEYDYQTEDEQVVESLIANDCLNEAVAQACEHLGVELDEHV